MLSKILIKLIQFKIWSNFCQWIFILTASFNWIFKYQHFITVWLLLTLTVFSINFKRNLIEYQNTEYLFFITKLYSNIKCETISLVWVSRFKEIHFIPQSEDWRTALLFLRHKNSPTTEAIWKVTLLKRTNILYCIIVIQYKYYIRESVKNYPSHHRTLKVHFPHTKNRKNRFKQSITVLSHSNDRVVAVMLRNLSMRTNNLLRNTL